jgi:hypothetical protein
MAPLRFEIRFVERHWHEIVNKPRQGIGIEPCMRDHKLAGLGVLCVLQSLTDTAYLTLKGRVSPKLLTGTLCTGPTQKVPPKALQLLPPSRCAEYIGTHAGAPEK